MLLRDSQRLHQGYSVHVLVRGGGSELLLEVGEGLHQHTLQEDELGDGVARPGGIVGVEEEGQLVPASEMSSQREGDETDDGGIRVGSGEDAGAA